MHELSELSVVLHRGVVPHQQEVNQQLGGDDSACQEELG